MKHILFLIFYTILFISSATIAIADQGPHELGYDFDGDPGNRSANQTVTMNYGCDTNHPCADSTYPYEIIVIQCTGDNPYASPPVHGDCTNNSPSNLIAQTGLATLVGNGSAFWQYSTSDNNAPPGCYQVDFYPNHSRSGDWWAGIFCYAPPITIGGRVTTSDGGLFKDVRINQGQTDPLNCNIGVSNATNDNGDYWYTLASSQYNLSYCLRPPAILGYSTPAGRESLVATATKMDYHFVYGCPTAPASVYISDPSGNSPYPSTTTGVTFNWTAGSTAPQRYKLVLVDTTDPANHITYEFPNLAASPLWVGNIPTTHFRSGHSYSWWVDAHSDFCNAKNTSSTFSIAAAATAPSVTTNDASGTTSSSTTFNGNVTADGGATVNGRGFLYKKSSDTSDYTVSSCTGTTPPTGTGCAKIGSGSGTGTFSANSADQGSLSASTFYKVRAYATNTAGTGYGNWLEFQTSPPPADDPTVATNDATGIQTKAATLNSTINPNGTATSTWFRYRGTFAASCGDTNTWGTATISTAKGSGTIDVNHSEAITGLTAGTTYWFCAIARNDAGTKILDQVRSFKTFDYTLTSTNPSITRPASGTTSISNHTITITPVSGVSGTRPVTITATSPQNGVTVSVNTPTNCQPTTTTSCNVTMTLTVSSSTSTGNPTITYSATSDGLTKPGSFNLTITDAATPPTVPSASGYSACPTNPYTVTLSWSGTPLPNPDPITNCSNGYWVDIDTNNNWSDGYFHKCVQGSTSTYVPAAPGAPSEFGAFAGASGTLTLQRGLTYQTRVYNGQNSTPNGTIFAAACGAAFNYSLTENNMTIAKPASGSTDNPNTVTITTTDGTPEGVTLNNVSVAPASSGVTAAISGGNTCIPSPTDCTRTISVNVSSTANPATTYTVTYRGTATGGLQKDGSFTVTITNASACTAPITPPANWNLTATRDDDYCINHIYRLSWNKAAGADHYNVSAFGLMDTNNPDNSVAQQATPTITVDTQIFPNNYTWWVTARDSTENNLCDQGSPGTTLNVPACPAATQPWFKTSGGDVHSNTSISVP